jgi:N6-L-threonylcarbamoyladenine synthase
VSGVVPLVLGIESTAHTFGVGIASEKGEILANVNSVYRPVAGGIKPSEAAEHHSRVAPVVLRRALEAARVSLDSIDAIAVALGPGLGPCLRVGATLARYLASLLGKPLVPVNHAVAHIEIARLSTGLKDPVVVYVAGGNTVITTFVEGRYRVFGETLDIALGNLMDTFAREVGLGFPGVPKVEELAARGKNLIPLPYSVKGQDVSYSGLLTAALRLYREKRYSLEDLCYSMVETAYSMLVEVAERALAHTGKSEVVLTGGVARSPILSDKLAKMARARGARFAAVDPELAGDNGAMIAYTGALAYASGLTIPVEESRVRPLWRLDEVEVPWRRQTSAAIT